MTLGKLKIFDFKHDPSLTNKKFLNIVSNLESYSTHPIKTAFTVTEKLTVHDFESLSGLGLTGRIGKDVYHLGNHKLLTYLEVDNHYLSEENVFTKAGCSIIYVVRKKKLIGIIGVKDVVREETKRAIYEAGHRGIEVVMLT